MGKTTIVKRKRVYNHIFETKRGSFERFAWVCVGRRCRVRSVLQKVLGQLTVSPDQKEDQVSSLNLVPQKQDSLAKMSVEDMIHQLCQIQTSNRCLIVLDDLWDTSDWRALEKAFNVQDSQTKILVTTRKGNVAEIGFSLKIDALDMDKAWELLNKKAFPNGNTPPPEPAFEEIGKKLVQKCGYLPLAICLLGGVLRKKDTCISEWESVNENIEKVLYRGQDEIDGIVSLSYENLSSHLKPCFLYMRILEVGESIHVSDLYEMWIAQGMISNENDENGETLMEVAEQYLSELASTSIVEVETEDLLPGRKYKSCKLHDLVWQICRNIGKKEAFGVKISRYEGGKYSTPRGARHLAIHFKNIYDGNADTRREDPNRHLRSLRILNDVDSDENEPADLIEFPPQRMLDFKKFKFLKELVIQSFRFEGRKLPKGITDLILLRCLRLRNCDLAELPRSIVNLVYLDTLDLLGSFNVRVPNALKKLSRLKHLLFDYDEDADDYIVNHRLTLDEGEYELESLDGFNSSVHELKDATSMKNLRHFLGDIYDNQSLSLVMEAIATKWNKLQFCGVVIGYGCEITSEDKLMELLTNPNLHYLKICVKLGKLLPVMSSDFTSSKIVALSLYKTQIKDDPMGILGKLPFLKQLHLYKYSFVGEKMKCSASSFPRLQWLRLIQLPSWGEWEVEQGAMPLLSEIHIHDCPRFEMIPDGFTFISTLQKLIISEMPELAKRVSASGEDFYKVSHIPYIDINDK